MHWTPISRADWAREERFTHYLKTIPCTYSITTNLDVTSLLPKLRQAGLSLYPVMLWLFAKLVNRHEEFRMSFNANGTLGVWDQMNPSYTVFHPEQEMFSTLWTAYDVEFSVFYRRYERDLEQYGDNLAFAPKPDLIGNMFPVSAIPWVSFTSFQLNLQKGYEYLSPIFTTGRYLRQEDKLVLPLSLQVHHAVCDGFHTARLFNELQNEINIFLPTART